MTPGLPSRSSPVAQSSPQSPLSSPHWRRLANHATDPIAADTDLDDFTDGFEIESGDNPRDGPDCSVVEKRVMRRGSTVERTFLVIDVALVWLGRMKREAGGIYAGFSLRTLPCQCLTVAALPLLGGGSAGRR